MKIFLICLVMYFLMSSLLVIYFRRNLIELRHILFFTLLFWGGFAFLADAEPTNKLAEIIGFKLASNMIFFFGFFVFSIYLIKLRMEIVLLNRKLRKLMNSVEIEKLRGTLK